MMSKSNHSVRFLHSDPCARLKLVLFGVMMIAMYLLFFCDLMEANSVHGILRLESESTLGLIIVGYNYDCHK